MDDRGHRVAIDASGNRYVTGYFFSSTITFGSTTLTNAGNNDMFIVKYDPLGAVLWAKSAGGPDLDRGFDVVVDGSGNVYVTGSFWSNSLSFGSITISNTGFIDVFVVKYDSSGNVLWANNAGGTQQDWAYGVGVDGSGNCYVTGYSSSGTMFFGSTALANVGNGSDIFIAKYSPSGNLIWAKNAGGNNSTESWDIAVDVKGNCYITGMFYGSTMNFGNNITVTNATPPEGDFYVAKYDSSGNAVWAKSAGGTAAEQGRGITIDGNGNSYVTGWFNSSSISFGTTILNTTGGYDGFVVKYDTAGTVVWAKSIAGGTASDYCQDIAVDGSGNSYVTGYFGSSILNFGSVTLTNTGSSGTPDVFVAKYDNSGSIVWVKGAGSSGDDQGRGIAVDGGGNSYVTGLFTSSSMTLGSTTLTNAGSVDIFNGKLGSGCASAPAQPGAINGSTTVCASSSQTFSVPTSTNAASYVWTLPSGWSGTSTGNSITTTVGSTAGNITVAAVNACGTSTAQTVTISSVLALPAQPGVITGSTTPCSGSSQTYSVAVVPNATSYTWTLPTGWTGTSTTNSITVTTDTTGGNITVSAVNTCGLSSLQTSAVTPVLPPIQPGTITGSTTPCSGSSQTYSVASVAGATSYTWTLPTGWAGTSTTNSISATVGSTGGNITVSAVNTCGSSPVETFNVASVLPMPSAVIAQTGNLLSLTASFASYQWYLNGNAILGETNQNYTAAQSGNYYVVVVDWNNCSGQSNTIGITVGVGEVSPENAFIIYPNPANNIVFVEKVKENSTYNLHNIIGSVVMKGDLKEGKNSISLDGMAAGVYILEVKNKDKIERVPVVVE